MTHRPFHPGYALTASGFAFSVLVGRHIVFNGDIYAKIADAHITSIAFPRDLIAFLLIACLSYGLLLAADCGIARFSSLPGRSQILPPKRYAFAAAALLILAWLPYLLSLSPGNVLDDSIDSIRQMRLHGHPTSSHHPIFYTLAVGVCMKLGDVLFHSANAGVQLYTLLQTALLIVCIVGLLALMAARGVPKSALLLSLLYFSLMPIFPTYAATMWKDISYSCALLLLSFLLLSASEAGDSLPRFWPLAYAAAGLVSMATRNNGVYVFAAVSFICLILLRRFRRHIAAASLLTLAFFLLVSGAAKRAWDIQEDFLESIGIPLRQLAYTINEGGEFSEEDRAYLLSICPEDVWRYAYRPCLVDPLKWNPQFDYDRLSKTKGQFFAVWSRGLLRNPMAYLKAYALATFGFLVPGIQHSYGYMWIEVHKNSLGITLTDHLAALFGNDFRNHIMERMIYIGSGTLLWLVLFALALSLRRGVKAILPFLPALFNLGTILIATPVSFSLRYVFIFALGLPFFLSLSFPPGHTCVRAS